MFGLFKKKKDPEQVDVTKCHDTNKWKRDKEIIAILSNINRIEGQKVEKDGITVEARLEQSILRKPEIIIKMNDVIVGTSDRHMNYDSYIYWFDWVEDGGMVEKYSDFILGLKDIVDKEVNKIDDVLRTRAAKRIKDNIDKIGL